MLVVGTGSPTGSESPDLGRDLDRAGFACCVSVDLVVDRQLLLEETRLEGVSEGG